jgi:hypothetical protein
VRFEEEQMKQTTYRVVVSDHQGLRHDSANFDHESEARTYARAVAQGGHSAYVLKIETEVLVEFLASYPPETPEDT